MSNWVITMFSEKVTDSCFELVDRLECKKKWLNPIVWGGLIISPAVLSLDVLVYKMLSSQKGILTDATAIVIAFIAILCLILIVGSFKKYFELRRLKRSLAELESFEEIVYQEVLRKDAKLMGKEMIHQR
ncbi:MAG: hypothetical protein NTV06_10235 [candidate division Zixibacteria bacterium]|nr:hypothetical protein [candidate division Zixibacteria bacterium]